MTVPHIQHIAKFILVFLLYLLVLGCENHGKNTPDNNLKIMIIRHAEKPEKGDNLSCQGQNRALQLSSVLYQKIKLPDYIFIPALATGEQTKHSRMFQTISPFAIKYNLDINSKFSAKDSEKVSKHVLKKSGTVLMVWEHSAIQDLAKQLGVQHPPVWRDADFDSVWRINYHDGNATLEIEQEQLTPSTTCNF